MPEVVKNDLLTPEEAVSGNVRCICLVLDEDIISGLQKLHTVLGFPVGRMLSDVLRPFVNTFLPSVDLKEKGELTSDVLPEIVKGLDVMVIKADVAKARFDRELKKQYKQTKLKGGVGNDRKDKNTSEKCKMS